MPNKIEPVLLQDDAFLVRRGRVDRADDVAVVPEVLRECDFAAWTLVAVGVLIAVTAPLLPRGRRSAKRVSS